MGKIERTDQELEESLLSYFLRNPSAADSVDGVSRWRLLDQRVHELVAETREALDRLVVRKLLERIEQPGMEPLYRLAEKGRSRAEQTASDRRPPRRRS